MKEKDKNLVSDKINIEYIKKHIRNKLFNIHYFDTIDSTQDAAKLINHIENNYELFISEQQTAGKGKYDRKWFSYTGGLYFSLSFYLNRPIESIGIIPIITSLAISDAIFSVSKIKSKIKWPNDIVITNMEEIKKISGILINTEIKDGQIKKCIIGIGINVNNIIPGKIKKTAISIKELTGKIIDRNVLIVKIINNFLFYLENYNQEKDKTKSKYLKKLIHINKPVNIKTYNDSYEGICTNIDENYNLIVENEYGHKQIIYAGDVFIK